MAAYALVLTACGGPKPAEPVEPRPTAPLPTAAFAGQHVVLFPLTLVAAEDIPGWSAVLADRRAVLDRADSIFGALLQERAPEVSWVPPAELRRVARRSAGVAPDPDQMGTALLRAQGLTEVPDPLRSQMRTLLALAGNRYALVPAALVYRRTGPPTGSGAAPAAGAAGAAELAVVLVDGRLGRVGWRTVARGAGDDPWAALAAAVKALTPGLP